jgi:Methyltransferase domain
MLRSGASGVNKEAARIDEGSEMVEGLLKDHAKNKARRPSFMMLLTCIASFSLGYSLGHYPAAKGHQENSVVNKTATTDACSEPMRNHGVPTFKNRNDLGIILEGEKKLVGVELGVQTGVFASEMLSRWPSCTAYYFVDLWVHQEHYEDLANVDQATHERYYHDTLERTKEWKDKIHVCRNYTSVCAVNMPDDYFDFIYVDARHDFKGVYEDLRDWWPKLRVGGIMAGHDYVTQDDGPNETGQVWTTNYDGTIDETGTVVKGAVDKFATEVCRQLTVGYREECWNTWAMRK